MKRIAVLLVAALALAGCATTQATQAPAKKVPQEMQWFAPEGCEAGYVPLLQDEDGVVMAVVIKCKPTA